MSKRRANGEGNLRKRSDGRWEGRYTAGYDPDTGKRIIKNVLGRTQAEAKEKLKAAVEQAHLWDREKFDAFLREDGPPSLERQAALEGLRDGLGLTPMEDSYVYPEGTSVF